MEPATKKDLPCLVTLQALLKVTQVQSYFMYVFHSGSFASYDGGNKIVVHFINLVMSPQRMIPNEVFKC